jgi:hypothetical protein
MFYIFFRGKPRRMLKVYQSFDKHYSSHLPGNFMVWKSIGGASNFKDVIRGIEAGDNN